MKFSEIKGTAEQMDALIKRYCYSCWITGVVPPNGYEFTGEIINVNDTPCQNTLVAYGGNSVKTAYEANSNNDSHRFFLEVKPVEKRYRWISDEEPRRLRRGEWLMLPDGKFSQYGGFMESAKDFRPFRREEISE